MNNTLVSAKRQNILVAANKIVQREGVAHLTIDAVAREAGLSKGGVLHYFPSKDALIEAMVAFLVEQFEREFAHRLVEEDPGPGQWLRAYIRASCYPEEQDSVTASGLIAAIANNPDLLSALQQQYASWQMHVEQTGLPVPLATILRLAVDGLWLAELLGLAPPTGKLREEVITELLKLAHSSPSS